jgi:hypothetical protein
LSLSPGHPIALRSLPVIVAFIPAVAALSNGGYFPVDWAWSWLAFSWLAVLGIIFGRERMAMREVLLFSALSALAIWTFVSISWGAPAAGAVPVAERTLLFATAALAFALLVRPSMLATVLLWLLIGLTAVCLYALSTRLFPQHFGGVDVVAGYRLARPIGYWNALGIYAAIGLAIAIGLGARAERGARAVAAATIPILAVTQYFTYSRGSAIALAAGLLATFALDRDRLQWLIVAGVTGTIAAVGVIAASRLPALTTVGSDVHRATSEGRFLAFVLVALCAATAGFALWRPLPTLRGPAAHWLEVAVTCAIATGIVVGLVAVGGPNGIKRKFTASPPVTNGQLNTRLFSFSGSYRAPLWHIAWDELKAHPVLGGGAGSYEAYYLRHRDTSGKVKNAHSLYLETLAELGWVGLGLLVVALLVPIYTAFKVRRHPLVPALAGAYVAFLVHMAVDWDWQVTAVALTGLFCGAGVLAAARLDENELWRVSPRISRSIIGAAGVIMIIAVIALAENLSMARASSAATAGNWAASARDARRAQTWAPWSSEPYRVLGEAQLGEGDTKSAIASFNKAIAKSRNDWNLWFDLARATTGNAQRDALRHAKQLNPLSPEIAELQKELNAEKVITVVPKSPAQK